MNRYIGLQWEYKKVGTDYDSTSLEDTIEDLLNGLGREGWELVMGTPLRTERFAFIFKRPKKASQE